MKHSFLKAFFTILCAFSLFGLSLPAEAYHYGDGRHHGYRSGHHMKCRYVNGHWKHGRWVPARRVCWRR